jgi:pimeloyl-ACP methyl ester carboxylesterase
VSLIDANGIRMHCRRLAPTGPGPDETVVFVHGLGTDSLASFYLTLAAPAAAAGASVVTYDLRGHGRSDRPDTGYSLDIFVDDLRALLEELDITHPVHLVGNSFGGTIAFAFADRFPDRVASVTAIEAEPPTELWATRMHDIMTRAVDFLSDQANYAWIREHRSAHQERLARLAAQRVLSTSAPREVTTGRLMTDGAVAELRCPVLLLVGSEGYQADGLDELTAALPRAEFVVFPGQGHSVLVERHREVRTLVLDWVARHAVTVS